MAQEDRPKLHCLCLSLAGAATLEGVVAENNLHREISGLDLALHPQPIFLPELMQSAGDTVALFLDEPLARYTSDWRLRFETAGDGALAPGPDAPPTVIEFKTPNELAEALSASNKKRQDRAYVAMRSVSSLSLRYADYLVSAAYMSSRRRRIRFVGSLETYAADIRRFFQGLGIERDIHVPDESANALSGPGELSPLAMKNLRAWYAGDVAIFNWASAYREQSLAEASSSEPGQAESDRSSPPRPQGKPSRTAMPRNDDEGILGLYADRPYVEAYRDHMNLRIRSDPHAAIGGKWEEMGQVQMDFLVARGLAAHHRLL